MIRKDRATLGTGPVAISETKADTIAAYRRSVPPQAMKVHCGRLSATTLVQALTLITDWQSHHAIFAALICIVPILILVVSCVLYELI
jgi:hypothetical protein